ncbi:nuclear transport factor 2 family protein [Microlunatus antarcticus]|uniref:Ketosteroid isomerase-like protein n=1 Tax=Microlunatus antarcticus TaxID=53388 RepID=A0A7W5JVR6_9ACTN|nr:nuclear transport factor 2 family protein [Microlunatus antarcticus]MBB3327178.1 ketosteroid isomerase-like protein [Microlunatus antarcticus]
MVTNRTDEFATALTALEGGGGLDTFLTVFADDVELHRPETQQELDGIDGARSFWRQYLGMFDEIRSDFSRVVDGPVGVLEWTSTGRLASGAPITYAGVSLLDFDDAGKVTRFATYFDTQAFGPTPAAS